MITLIACIGKNNELGKNNDLVFRLKADLRFFAHATKNHTVVMGSNTWESIPNQLADRLNLVVSSKAVDRADGTISDFESFLKFHEDSGENVFVIGGGSIYEQALPYAKMMYLTEVDATVSADVFFPTFTKSQWNVQTLQSGTEDSYKYNINLYTKK